MLAQLLEGDNWKYGILIIGIVFIIMAMFSLGRGRKQKSGQQPSARDHLDRARQKQGVRDELEALMVDINRMAKDLGGQLDAKIVRIEKATEEAEQRIAQLQALRAELNQPLVYPPPSVPPAPTVPAAPASAEILGQGAAGDAHGPDAPADQADQADPLTRQVYQLADQGVDPGDIAQRLGEHIGKIELILALRAS